MAEIVIIGISTILRRFLAVCFFFCEIIGNRHCNHQLAKQNIQIRKHGQIHSRLCKELLTLKNTVYFFM